MALERRLSLQGTSDLPSPKSQQVSFDMTFIYHATESIACEGSQGGQGYEPFPMISPWSIEDSISCGSSPRARIVAENRKRFDDFLLSSSGSSRHQKRRKLHALVRCKAIQSLDSFDSEASTSEALLVSRQVNYAASPRSATNDDYDFMSYPQQFW